jgi:spoIIIJ-associated protein
MAQQGSVFQGRTLDDAVRKGLEALGLSRAEVMITIIEEGSGGFLGLGARPYKVRVMPRPGGAPSEPDLRGDRGDRSRRPRGREGRPRERSGREVRAGAGRGDRGGRPARAGREERPGAVAGSIGGRGVPEERGPREERPRRDDRHGRSEPRGRVRDDRPARAPGGNGEERRPRFEDSRSGDDRRARRDEAPRQDERRLDERRAAPPGNGGDDRTGAPPEEGRRRRRGRRGGRGRGPREGAPAETMTARPEAEPMHAPPLESTSPARPMEHRPPAAEPERHAAPTASTMTDEAPGWSNDELAAEGKRWTERLLQAMGFEATVTATAAESHVDVTAAVTADEELLTGRKGEVRQALQHLLNRMINRGEGSRYHLQLEINEFWKRREDELRELARALADDALARHAETVTEYLNAQERRIVHMTLRDDPRVKTYALGDGMIKRVAIAPADFEAGPGDDE